MNDDTSPTVSPLVGESLMNDDKTMGDVTATVTVEDTTGDVTIDNTDG